MNYIPYIIKFLYRVRYWIICLPLLVGIFAYIQTGKMSRKYTAYSTIYTGLITGVNILSESGLSTTTTSQQNSMMDNFLNIITSDQTLKHVSLRLYARSMVYGPKNDDSYISLPHYEYAYNHGAEIHSLIDRSSPNDSINEQRTYENLLKYENDRNHYVYGIYRQFLPYFNRNDLKTITVEQDGKSDMLEISYTTDDRGIAYQTLRILNEEFLKQYQELRYGETNDVIAYFEKELKRIGEELRKAEDSLTLYSIQNRVINYDEETKQIATLSKEYELGYWSSFRNNESSKKLIDNLEQRIGANARIFKNNSEFLNSMQRMSALNQQLTLPQPYTQEGPIALAKDSIRGQLLGEEEQFDAIVNKYGEFKHSKEGLSSDDIVLEWLGQQILQDKSTAELEAMKKNRNELDTQYIHYAPIGSTLTRKERAVSIAEKEYFSIMTALNNARLRQKSLQMTSATLKVMNEPAFPEAALDNNRRKIVFGITVGVFIFVLFFFLLVELLDRTLRDGTKVKTITGGLTAGAFTRFFRARLRRYNQIYADISAKTLCHFACTYFKPEKNNIINIISHEPGEGKSFVMEQLASHFSAMGMEVTKLSWHNKFETDAKAFIQSLDLPNLDAVDKLKTKDNVILVEYPSLREAALTKEILNGVSINLLVVDSRRTWQTPDQTLYERTKDMAGNTPLFFVLNHTKIETAEDFNGLMPPYTFFRKLFYRILQLGLTSHTNYNRNA